MMFIFTAISLRSFATCDDKIDSILSTQKLYEDEANLSAYFDMFDRWHTPFLQETYDSFESLIPTNGRVIDVAVGKGRDFRYFHERDYIVDGNELSQNMSKMALDNLEIDGLEFSHHFFHELGDQVQYFEKFDGVWAYSALVNVHHDDLLENLASLAKITKPGGAIFFNVQHGPKGTRVFQRESKETGRMFTSLDEADLKKLLKEVKRKFGIKLEIEYSAVRPVEGPAPDWFDIMVVREKGKSLL